MSGPPTDDEAVMRQTVWLEKKAADVAAQIQYFDAAGRAYILRRVQELLRCKGDALVEEAS